MKLPVYLQYKARYNLCDCIYVNLKQAKLLRQNDQWSLEAGVGGKTVEGHQGAFQGDVNVLYLACGGGNVHICQNSLNYILKIGEFYYIRYVLIKLV